MRTFLSILAILAVAACSGGGSSGGGTAGIGSTNGDSDLVFDAIASASAAAADTDAVNFATALDTFQDDVADVDGRPLDDYNFTKFTDVPSTGTASYSGFINVNAGPSADLTAGLDVDVNFVSEALTADQTTDFFANSNGDLVAYNGELTFTNGKIQARGVDNSARLDIAGTLTGAGNSVVVDGEIFGKLVGTPIVGISANTTVAEAAATGNPERAMNITLNGNAVSDGSAGFVVIDDTLR
ncbi:MAG: hypothetical protein AAFP98_05670 [Pseudomonadota bacterium]